MDKKILLDYMDACELIKETETDIRKIKRRKDVVQDCVRGSNPDWPYEARSFRVVGTTEQLADRQTLEEEERILQERKANAERIKMSVEGWMITIPARMQRIIRLKLFEGLSWEQVAKKVGGNATENSLKKEFERFMKKS